MGVVGRAPREIAQTAEFALVVVSSAGIAGVVVGVPASAEGAAAPRTGEGAPAGVDSIQRRFSILRGGGAQGRGPVAFGHFDVLEKFRYLVKDLVLEINKASIVLQLMTEYLVDVVWQANVNELESPEDHDIFQGGRKWFVFIEECVVPVRETVSLLEEAVTDGGAELFVEGVVGCAGGVGDVGNFEKVCALVRKVVFLFQELEDPV